MKIKTIRTSNNLKKKLFNKFLLKKISINFPKIEKEILAEIEDTNQTLNILNDNFNFNFNLKTLKRFKKFNSIVMIGMGGSILGAESIYQFLENKIKKNFYFFDDLNTKKNTLFKNKKKLKKNTFPYNFKIRKNSRNNLKFFKFRYFVQKFKKYHNYF